MPSEWGHAALGMGNLLLKNGTATGSTFFAGHPLWGNVAGDLNIQTQKIGTGHF